MAYDFPFDAVIDELQERMKTVYSIPDGNPILESGIEPYNISRDDLPAGVLEVSDGVTISDGLSMGFSQHDIVEQFDVYLWIIRKSVKDENENLKMRATLSAMATNLLSDDRLGGTVSRRPQLIKYDWTGTSRDWPILLEQGIGSVAGFVAARLTLVENKF